MAEAGGAVVVPDDDLDGARLAQELEALLATPGRLEAMARSARTLARPDAAAAVARLAVDSARPRRPQDAKRGDRSRGGDGAAGGGKEVAGEP